jgi:hypothetical protein
MATFEKLAAQFIYELEKRGYCKGKIIYQKPNSLMHDAACMYFIYISCVASTLMFRECVT